MTQEKESTGHSVLILETDPVSLNILIKALTSGGYNVAGVARDGKEAIKLYDDLQPAAALIELKTIDLKGFEPIQEIKRSDPEANVIIMSNFPRNKYLLKAKKLGVRDYIEKPVNPRHLIEVIGRIITPTAAV